MRRSLAVAGLTATALVTCLVAGPPVTRQAAAAASPVTAASVSPGPFSVDGLTGTVTATVSVVLVGGGPGSCNQDFEYMWKNAVLVALTRTAGGPADVVTVRLVKHQQLADGAHWTGGWKIGSTRSGTWTITHAGWCSGAESYGYDPRDQGLVATTTVHGTHPPTLSTTHVPAVVRWDAKQWLVATLRDGYGHRLAHFPIVYGADTSCGSSDDGSSLVTTDRHGRVTIRLYRSLWECLYLVMPPRLPISSARTVLIQRRLERYTYYETVRASAPAGNHPVGVPVTITATLISNVGTASLQRLVGRTWRTVMTAPTVSGVTTIALTFTPTSAGLTYLRVLARPSAEYVSRLAPTVSPTVMLRAT